MKILKVNDVTYGKNHTDMINKALGANIPFTANAGIEMSEFGAPNVLAWFVYMDGSMHGYPNGWLWRNYLSPDKTTIREYNVGTSKQEIRNKQLERGFYPYRLAFRLDPYENGDKHCCKFVGAFALSGFIEDDLSAIKYTKLFDSFTIGAKGEYGSILNGKTDFIKIVKRYNTPIENLGLSDKVLSLLKRARFKYVYELLEVGLSDGDAALEIRQKLLEFFREK